MTIFVGEILRLFIFKLIIMEPNWIIVSAVITTAIALIIFLIWRNQRDKKELEEKLIDEDELSVPKSNETEDNSLV